MAINGQQVARKTDRLAKRREAYMGDIKLGTRAVTDVKGSTSKKMTIPQTALDMWDLDEDDELDVYFDGIQLTIIPEKYTVNE